MGGDNRQPPLHLFAGDERLETQSSYGCFSTLARETTVLCKPTAGTLRPFVVPQLPAEFLEFYS